MSAQKLSLTEYRRVLDDSLERQRELIGDALVPDVVNLPDGRKLAGSAADRATLAGLLVAYEKRAADSAFLLADANRWTMRLHAAIAEFRDADPPEMTYAAAHARTASGGRTRVVTAGKTADGMLVATVASP